MPLLTCTTLGEAVASVTTYLGPIRPGTPCTVRVYHESRRGESWQNYWQLFTVIFPQCSLAELTRKRIFIEIEVDQLFWRHVTLSTEFGWRILLLRVQEQASVWRPLVCIRCALLQLFRASRLREQAVGREPFCSSTSLWLEIDDFRQRWSVRWRRTPEVPKLFSEADEGRNDPMTCHWVTTTFRWCHFTEVYAGDRTVNGIQAYDWNW